VISKFLYIALIATILASCSRKFPINIDYEDDNNITDSLGSGLYKVKLKYFIVIDSTVVSKCYSNTSIKYGKFGFLKRECDIKTITSILDGHTYLTELQKNEISEILFTLKKW